MTVKVPLPNFLLIPLPFPLNQNLLCHGNRCYGSHEVVCRFIFCPFHYFNIYVKCLME